MDFYSFSENENLTVLNFRDEVNMSVLALIDIVASALRGASEDSPIDEGAAADTLYVASERLGHLIDYMIQQGGFKGCKCNGG